VSTGRTSRKPSKRAMTEGTGSRGLSGVAVTRSAVKEEVVARSHSHPSLMTLGGWRALSLSRDVISDSSLARKRPICGAVHVTRAEVPGASNR
jgi:hypothetical protein